MNTTSATFVVTVNNNKVQIPRESISRVYIGKPNKCGCGCSGTYTDADGAPENMAIVDRVLRRIRTAANVQQAYWDGTMILSVESGRRAWWIYCRV